jgi:hypothetical protein
MNTCTRCPAPARWRDADGRQFCGSHVPANGKPLARMPAEPEPPEPDILERLDEVINESELLTIGRIGGRGGLYRVGSDIVEDAADEIRRLRALLEAAGDKSGSC